MLENKIESRIESIFILYRIKLIRACRIEQNIEENVEQRV